MTIDPFSVATGYELIKIAKREGWIKSLIDRVRPKHRALVLGSTGVGKSQFLKSIPELAAPAISHAARTEFVVASRFELNSRLFEFIDTPGQLEHRLARESATKDAIKANLKGIVNFVSFGYHEYGLPSEQVFYRDNVRASYLDEHRKREKVILKEWASLLSTEWILTVVTKADVWYDERNEVAEYYRRGPYREELDRLFPNANPILRPYSSITSRFYGKLPVAGSFEDQVRSNLRTELFRVLRESVDRKQR